MTFLIAMWIGVFQNPQLPIWEKKAPTAVTVFLFLGLLHLLHCLFHRYSLFCSLNVGITLSSTRFVCFSTSKCCEYWLDSFTSLLSSSIIANFINCLQTPMAMALKQASVWALSLFRFLSCWFCLRCMPNFKYPLLFHDSRSRKGKASFTMVLTLPLSKGGVSTNSFDAPPAKGI